jgi:hypothetical protein
MREERFKFSDRAMEKAHSRARDEDRLKAGEVSPADLRQENSFFKSSGFAKKKIGVSLQSVDQRMATNTSWSNQRRSKEFHCQGPGPQAKLNDLWFRSVSA